MQRMTNAAQTNTWASVQSIDFSGPTFEKGSLQLVYTDATTTAKTFGGVREVDQITFAAKASTTNGDYFVINDYLGGAWAIGLDTLGTGAATPTGAAWVAVAAANKAYVDISLATTGTEVEVIVATAINALTGFTDVITAVNSTTHMNCTAAYAGVVTAPTVYSRAGAAGTGSITKSVTTAGTSAAVNTSTDRVTLAAHGQVTGSKVALTTAGTLPTGVTATNYWLIVIDANTFQFASSLANAAAGTAIDLTTPGFGTHTITPALLATTGAVAKLQVSNDGTNFTDVTSATVTITAAGNTYWELCVQATGRPLYPSVFRVLFTPTTGTVTLKVIPNFYA
jgi:hypothetical protein